MEIQTGKTRREAAGTDKGKNCAKSDEDKYHAKLLRKNPSKAKFDRGKYEP